MFITLGVAKLVSDNPYKVAKVEKLISPNTFNMEGWYGGRAKWIAKVKDSPLYLVVDQELETIDVGVDTENVEGLSTNQVRDVLRKDGIVLPFNASKEQIYDALKEHFKNK